MSVENVKKFYKRLEEDEAFRTEFQRLGEDEAFRAEIANDEAFENAIMDKLITVAGKHGYEFTKADLATLKEEYSDRELRDSELENVVGGDVGYTKSVCFIFGLGWWAPDDSNGIMVDGDSTWRPAFCFLIGYTY